MHDKKRVLMIGPSINRSKGGMATVINDIREDVELNQKYDIDFLPSYRDGNIIVRILYSFIAFIEFCLIYKRYDLFHIHMASYGSTFRKALYVLMLKRRRKRVILHIHGGSYLAFYEGLSGKKKKFVIETLKKADLVIALSEQWKRDFEITFGIKNCIAVCNGINVETYKSAQPKGKEQEGNFLFLGRLSRKKGIYDLIDAIEKVVVSNKNIKCFVAGDGEIIKVSERIKSKGLEKYFEIAGWVEHEDKKRLMAKSSVMILPSYNEGLPMAILESMAAGLAIISTDVGAIPEVIQSNENGFLVQPGNVNELAAAITACLGRPESVAAMAQNNIQKVTDKFSLQHMHRQLMFYYEQVLDKQQ